MKKLIIFLFFLALSRTNSQTTNFQFDRITIDNGLSNNSINSILQTKDGFLWIATKDGLNRYDGSSFELFKSNTKEQNSLPENYVMSLLETQNGDFWIGTWGGGLCKFDPIHETFIRYDNLQIYEDDYIQCLIEDWDNNIWFGTTGNGINCLSSNSKKIKSYNTKNSLTSDNIICITYDNSQNLWLGTFKNGIICFNPENKKFTHYTKKSTNGLIADDRILSFYNDSQKDLWVGTFLGITKMNFENRTLESVHIKTSENSEAIISNISQIWKDKNNRFWFGTYDYNGIFLKTRKETEADIFVQIKKEKDNPNSIITDRIRWIYEDKFNNLWFGTEDGLNKLPFKQPFVQYRYFPFREGTIGGRVVSSIVEGKKFLWVGFGGDGFDKIDLLNNKIEHFNENYMSKNQFNRLKGADVITLLEDREEILWIGTSNGGLNRFDPINNKFKYYASNSKKPNSIKSDWVQQIIEMKDNKLLIGTNETLEIFDKRTESFSTFNIIADSPSEKLPKTLAINVLYEDKENNLWIGTWLDGLFQYDTDKKKLFHYMPNKDREHQISSTKITCILEDSKGYIWVGTHSGGLNKFDKKQNNFNNYTIKNGLPNDVIFGILEDKKGNLWISTMKGLAKFNPSTENFRIYDKSDGIINNQFNWRASFKNQNGIMYFGGLDGFIKFDPDSILTEEHIPRVAFISFKVFNKEAELKQSLPSTKKIFLNYDQNFFSIEYAVLDFNHPENHLYEYMLKGIDPNWVHAEKRKTAFYTDIKSGEYTFYVKAVNSDGKYSEVKTLSIIIDFAWWMTWWFKFAIILLFVSFVFLVYKLRINQLLKIERLRLDIANDLHDEIGSSLSSIRLDSEMLLVSNSLKEPEQELAKYISKTAKETIESVRDIVWFINPQNDFGNNMINKMKEESAKLLVGIDWSLTTAPQINVERLNLEVRRNIYLIFKEAINNISKHAHAKICNIYLGKKNEHFFLLIKDDGIGFEQNEINENNGLKSMKRRASKINASLNIISELNKGTILELMVFDA